MDPATALLVLDSKSSGVNRQSPLDGLVTCGRAGQAQQRLFVAGVDQCGGRVIQPAPSEPRDRGRPERSVAGRALGLQARTLLQQAGQIGHHQRASQLAQVYEPPRVEAVAEE